MVCCDEDRMQLYDKVVQQILCWSSIVWIDVGKS